MKAKYLILDFGKVLAYPVTGDWFITPLFYEYVNKDKLDKEKFHKCMVEIGDMLGGILKNEQEEYEIFALVAFLCILLELILRNTVLKKIP